MQRLRGGDAQMIYNETPTSPFVTLKAMIYEPVNPGSAPDVEELEAFICKGIASWARKGLGLRILRVPLDLHHPVWVEDPNFSLDDHIHHIALPAPGDKQRLCNFISYVMSMPLDPTRPLWDSWIVEGLEGGRVAWVCKMHHVLGDGLMSAEHINNIHHQDAAQPASAGDAPAIITAATSMPGSWQLVKGALRDLARGFIEEFPTYFREFRRARATSNKEPVENAYGPMMAPYTFFNQPGGPYRIYRYETFSLTQFKALSRKLDCTINDLVLALCSQALRRYILDIEPLPSKPLVVVMPIGNRGNDIHPKFLNTEIMNNSVSIAFVPLDLQIEDFVERLESIKRGSRAAMEQIRRTRGARMENLADFLPGSFFRLSNWVLAWRQHRKQNPLASAAISNVPGPREPLFACDGKLKMVELLSCGNLVDSSALGITVWSYLDKLCFSCFFRKGTMPHPEKFTSYLDQAYQQLRAEHAAGD
jgi:diacylglycerol O-acyltransferase / wax synthase